MKQRKRRRAYSYFTYRTVQSAYKPLNNDTADFLQSLFPNKYARATVVSYDLLLITCFYSCRVLTEFLQSNIYT